jgi:hypothetical protein
VNDATWRVPVGVDADFVVRVTQDDGETPVAFTGSEAFACSLWQGDDLTPVDGVLSPAWITDETLGLDPADGSFVVSVMGSATLALASDAYQVRIVVVGAGGRTYEAYKGVLWLEDAPGAAAVPVTYCTLQDMLDVCGDWLIPLMQDSGKTSFLAERARASRTFQQAVLFRSRPYSAPGGIDLLTWTNSYEGPDVYLSGLIDDGRLVTTPDVAEAVAYLAASYVCERQLTWDGDDPHARQADHYYRKYRARLAGLTVGVDYSTAGDGSAIRSFNMGVFSSR